VGRVDDDHTLHDFLEGGGQRQAGGGGGGGARAGGVEHRGQHRKKDRREALCWGP
jgi:hypothetical protein